MEAILPLPSEKNLREAVLNLCTYLPNLGGLNISVETCWNLDFDEFCRYCEWQAETRRQIASAMARANRRR